MPQKRGSLKVQDRLTTGDYLNLACSLGLNDNQRFLFLALPMLADVNGTLEYNPNIILNCCNDNRPADLAQLFNVMEKNDLLEYFEHNGQKYIYLTTFLSSQKLRTIAKLPSHPSVKFLPEHNEKYNSQGRYFDVRMPPNDMLAKLNTIDKKPTLEEKGRDIKKISDFEIQTYKPNELKELELDRLYEIIGVEKIDFDEGFSACYDPRTTNPGIHGGYMYRIWSRYEYYKINGTRM